MAKMYGDYAARCMGADPTYARRMRAECGGVLVTRVKEVVMDELVRMRTFYSARAEDEVYRGTLPFAVTDGMDIMAWQTT